MQIFHPSPSKGISRTNAAPSQSPSLEILILTEPWAEFPQLSGGAHHLGLNLKYTLRSLILAQDPGRFRLEQDSVRSGFRQLWLFSLFPAGRRGRCRAELPASRREGRRRTDGPLGVGDHVSDLTLGWIQTSFRTQALRLQRFHFGTQHLPGANQRSF